MVASALAMIPVIFSVKMLLIMLAGVVIGTIGGALPGISASVTLALLLPVSFGMEPIEGLVFLGAVYTAAEYGCAIPAILINTPGKANAICTALDGYPMAVQGKAMEALHISCVGSVIGAVSGTLALLFFTPTLAHLSLYFGSPETFWLAVAGLVIVCNLAAESFMKGIIAVGVGMSLALVGEDLQTGVLRYTFGSIELSQGLALVPAILGLFAVSQMLMTAGVPGATAMSIERAPGSFLRTIHFIFTRPMMIFRSSLIGVVIGILPGVGASVSSFLAYGEERRWSRHPERFGHGAPEGLFASETANNADVGGSLIPLLAFGIPGSASAAVLFGGLTIHGMLPGPRLFSEHGDLIYGFIIAFFPIAAVVLAVGTNGARLFCRIVDVPHSFVVPTVMSLVVIGAYSFHSSMTDVFVALGTGILGYLLIRFKFSIASMVLGFVLGPMAEESLRRTIALGHAEGSTLGLLFGRPISLVLICFVLFMATSAFISEFRRRRSTSMEILKGERPLY